MAKRSLEKKSLLILKKFLFLAGFALLLIVGYSVYQLHALQDVKGAATTNTTPTFERFPILSCNQCIRGGKRGKTLSLCFHNNGRNSYADCQSGVKTSSDNVICVTCGTVPTITPRPSISQIPTTTPTGSVTPAPTK